MTVTENCEFTCGAKRWVYAVPRSYRSFVFRELDWSGFGSSYVEGPIPETVPVIEHVFERCASGFGFEPCRAKHEKSHAVG